MIAKDVLILIVVVRLMVIIDKHIASVILLLQWIVKI